MIEAELAQGHAGAPSRSRRATTCTRSPRARLPPGRARPRRQGVRRRARARAREGLAERACPARCPTQAPSPPRARPSTRRGSRARGGGRWRGRRVVAGPRGCARAALAPPAPRILPRERLLALCNACHGPRRPRAPVRRLPRAAPRARRGDHHALVIGGAFLGAILQSAKGHHGHGAAHGAPRGQRQRGGLGPLRPPTDRAMRRSSEATLTTALAALTLGVLALGCAKSETASSGPAKAGRLCHRRRCHRGRCHGGPGREPERAGAAALQGRAQGAAVARRDRAPRGAPSRCLRASRPIASPTSAPTSSPHRVGGGVGRARGRRVAASARARRARRDRQGPGALHRRLHADVSAAPQRLRRVHLREHHLQRQQRGRLHRGGRRQDLPPAAAPRRQELGAPRGARRVVRQARPRRPCST
jgi:hypothetical protein